MTNHLIISLRPNWLDNRNVENAEMVNRQLGRLRVEVQALPFNFAFGAADDACKALMAGVREAKKDEQLPDVGNLAAEIAAEFKELDDADKTRKIASNDQ